jgi:hypothetical protein
MLRRVALLITEVSDEHIAPINRSTLLVTSTVVPSYSILVILMMEVIFSSKTFILTRATGRNIQEDGIHPSHRRDLLLGNAIT